MRERILLGHVFGFALALALVGHSSAEDTFSIVAVDLETGQVGSAGASCISGSIIISDVHPGVGAIHTQSYWNAQNQNYARWLMDQGYAPEAIIDSLVANDAQGNPTIRQYGIVDMIDGGRSAGYSGSNCIDYKGHNLGQTYAIAGNILLGQEILDDMESGFSNTPGALSDKLMAALQGANVPGADTRCMQYGKPAISAFIRVARPNDPPGGYYLDLNVNNTSASQNPIDILQDLYDEWLQTVGMPEYPGGTPVTVVLHENHPNPFSPSTRLSYELKAAARVVLRIYNVAGQEVATLVDAPQSPGVYQVPWDCGGAVPAGVYFYRLSAGSFVETRRMVHAK